MSHVKVSKENLFKVEKGKLQWFVCLITYTQNGIVDPSAKDTQKSSLSNRTILVGTWVPMRLLELMNSYEDENIVSAAEKALKSPKLLSADMVLDLRDDDFEEIKQSTIPRYKHACIVGPITDFDYTGTVVKFWEKTSRGQKSRAGRGYGLAMWYNIGVGLNVKHLLGIEHLPSDKIEVKVEYDDRKKKMIINLQKK